MEYVYAALLLHKLGKPVDEEHLNNILQAGGVTVDESKVKSLVASLKGLDIDAEIASAVVASANAPSAGAAGSKVEEEKKEEKKAEESVAGLSALFG